MAAMPDSREEILEYFDGSGNLLGLKKRKDICDPKQGIYEWHNVSNVWLINSRGQMLVTQRSYSLAGSPGKWQSYLGGHVKAGITFVEGVIGEAEEEVGLKLKEEDLYLIDKGRYEPWKHFYESYAYLYNGRIENLKYVDGEVIDAKWMTFEEYNRDFISQPESWCCGCSLENQKKIKNWLSRVNLSRLI